MHGKHVDQLVFERLFPERHDSDPPNFAGFLQRFLVLEVRHETHAFYGHLDTLEAKYPGLDYNNRVHRVRLSRWPWHRRLFRAFDALRLTPHEISGLTRWEGTKWAKERFEREQGFVIRDTAADDIPPFVKPEHRPNTSAAQAPATEGGGQSGERQRLTDAITCTVAQSDVEGTASGSRGEGERGGEGDDDDDDDDDDEDDDDGELQSVGADLNERLQERVALRDASGNTSIPLDEEWETWFKDALESGQLPHLAQHIATAGPHAQMMSSAVAAAEAGRWSEVHDLLRDVHRWSLGTPPGAMLAQLARQARQARQAGPRGSVGQPAIGSRDGTQLQGAALQPQQRSVTSSLSHTMAEQQQRPRQQGQQQPHHIQRRQQEQQHQQLSQQQGQQQQDLPRQRRQTVSGLRLPGPSSDRTASSTTPMNRRWTARPAA